MRLKNMADEHIQNCINLADTDTRKYWEIAKPIFEKEMKRRDTKRLVFRHGDVNHLRPQYYSYKGGWTNVNSCGDCGRLALSEDMYVSNPCPSCGGPIVCEKLVGMWNHKENKWETMKKKQASRI